MLSLVLKQCNIAYVGHFIFKTGTLNKLREWRCLCNITSSVLPKRNVLSTFEGVEDRYNGITVDSAKEECHIEDFSKKLDESLKKWIGSKRRSVWFKIGIDKADWVPILAKNGFKLHHTKDNILFMYKWISDNVSDSIPPYAHTMVGVGGLVVNDTSRQVLVVSEKHYTFPQWKLPGGVVNPDEDLIDAVIREVQEETGVKSEFHSLLTVRHAHKRAYNCSDLYITFALKPLTTEINKCDREIKDCKWMDVDEFLNHPRGSQMNRLVMGTYLEYKKRNIRFDCKTSIHEILKFPVQTYYALIEN